MSSYKNFLPFFFLYFLSLLKKHSNFEFMDDPLDLAMRNVVDVDATRRRILIVEFGGICNHDRGGSYKFLGGKG